MKSKKDNSIKKRFNTTVLSIEKLNKIKGGIIEDTLIF